MLELTRAEMIALHWAARQVRDNRELARERGVISGGAVDDVLREGLERIRAELASRGVEVPA